MLSDQRRADLVGVALVVFVVVAIALIVLAAATAPSRQLPEPPDAEWTIQRVDGGHVEIVHDGGEPVSAEQLVVSVAGVERAPGRADELTEGEALLVPARPDQAVELYWVAGRDERVLLAEWRAP